MERGTDPHSTSSAAGARVQEDPLSYDAPAGELEAKIDHSATGDILEKLAQDWDPRCPNCYSYEHGVEGDSVGCGVHVESRRSRCPRAWPGCGERICCPLGRRARGLSRRTTRRVDETARDRASASRKASALGRALVVKKDSGGQLAPPS